MRRRTNLATGDIERRLEDSVFFRGRRQDTDKPSDAEAMNRSDVDDTETEGETSPPPREALGEATAPQASKPARKRASKPASPRASEQASSHASTLAPDSIVTAIRNTVKETGKEVGYARLTADEKRELARVLFACKDAGRKTSETEIIRIAINLLLEDHRLNTDQSVLARVLEALEA